MTFQGNSFNVSWHSLLCQFALVILILFSSSRAVSETVEDLLELSLEELANYEVSAATKSMMKLSQTPGSVSVIGYEQIKNSAAQTIPELLRLVPGVNVRWNPMVQTIDIRGFGSNPFTSRVLLLIDGIPYNSWNKGGFPQQPGFDFFNLANVKHLEVIRGAGSALYGENALSGVINIVTLSGEEYQHSSSKILAGDRNTRILEISHGQALSKDSSVFVTARAIDSQLPAEPWKNFDDSRTNGVDLFFKGKYKDFQLSYYLRDDSFDGYERPGGPGVFRSADKIEQTVSILSGQYDYLNDDETFSLQTNLAYSERRGSYCAGCHAQAQSSEFPGTADHGYQLFTNLQLGFHGIENHDLLLGVEARRVNAGDHKQEFIGSTQTGGSGEIEAVTSYNKAALFAQDSWSPTENLRLISGLRYDGETAPDLFSGEISPRLAMVWQPQEKWTIRAGWNKASRYPSFNELYQNTWFIVSETPTVNIPFSSFVPNPDLQPENISSYELGFQYHYSSNVQFRMDFFRNKITNPIIIAYPQIKFINHQNDAISKGFEMELKAQASDSLSGFANWSWQKNHQQGPATDGLLEFSYSPKYKVNLGLSWTPVESLTATVEMSWRDKYYGPSFWYQHAFHDDPTVRPLDSYRYINLHLKYQLYLSQFGLHEPVTISLYGKNLTDETPYESITGFGGKAPGEEYFLQLEFHWDDLLQ